MVRILQAVRYSRGISKEATPKEPLEWTVIPVLSSESSQSRQLPDVGLEAPSEGVTWAVAPARLPGLPSERL